jgi:hypothetical protein
MPRYQEAKEEPRTEEAKEISRCNIQNLLREIDWILVLF